MISRANLRSFANRSASSLLKKRISLKTHYQSSLVGHIAKISLQPLRVLRQMVKKWSMICRNRKHISLLATGLLVHNCGEQGLPPFGVCNLGALNLSAFVLNGQMDWAHLAEMSKVAMRFLDNVVDANEYFIEENQEAQLGTRRTGLGTMGLADALIKMKVSYGSEESVPIIERIYATIRDASYEVSADIAAEKGAFPILIATSICRDIYTTLTEADTKENQEAGHSQRGAVDTGSNGYDQPASRCQFGYRAGV